MSPGVRVVVLARVGHVFFLANFLSRFTSILCRDQRRTLTLRIILPILLCVSCGLPRAAGQVYAYHPQANPLVTISSNGYPFGAGAPGNMQFVNHIPAAALDLSNPFITDVSFFGAQTGVWSSGAVKVGIGHLTDPPPCTLTIPGGARAP